MVATQLKPNKTTSYLLPLLKFSQDFFKELKRNGFVNLYLKDDGQSKEYSGCIFLLMKPLYLNEEFNRLDEKLRGHKLFHDFYEVDSDSFMYVFKFHSIENIYILENFKLSRYSKLTALLPYFTATNTNGTMCVEYHSIAKTPQYKAHLEKEFGVQIDPTWEIGQALKLEDETFRFNNSGD